MPLPAKHRAGRARQSPARIVGTAYVLDFRSRQMAAASKRIGRLRRIDRAAVFVITLGGIAVVVAVLGILVFVASEAMPLFRDAQVDLRSETANRDRARLPTQARVTDCGRRRRVPQVRLHRRADGRGRVLSARLRRAVRIDMPVPGLEGATVASSSRSVTGQHVAAGLSDGRVSLMQVRFVPHYEGETLKDVTIEVRPQATIVARSRRAAGHARSRTSSRTGRSSSPASSPTTRLRYWWTDARGRRATRAAPRASQDRITHVRIGRNGALLAGTDAGLVYHWEMRRAARAHRRLAGQPRADHRARMDARRQLVGGRRRRRNPVGLAPRAGREDARRRWCGRTPSSRRRRRS